MEKSRQEKEEKCIGNEEGSVPLEKTAQEIINEVILEEKLKRRKP